MRLSPVLHVFCKELLDILRDRRTLVFMLVIPIVAIPVLMWVTTQLMSHFMEKLAREKAQILVINPEAAPGLVEQLRVRASLVARAKDIARLLEEKGITYKDLGMAQEHPEAFLRILEKRGVDPDELFPKLRAAVEEEDFDPTPGNIIAQAFPPNFQMVTKLDASLGDFRDPSKKQQVLLQAVRTEKIAAAVEFAPDTQERISGLDSAEVQIHYLETSDRSTTALRGLKGIFRTLGKHITTRRLVEKDLPQGFASPLPVKARRLPGPSILVKILSQILPYLILILAFLGALYPAIDLGAGEKERGTLETLLVAPVSRLSIVLGKFGVVLAAALISAVLGTLSLAVSMQTGIFSTMALVSGESFTFRLTEAVMALLMVLPIACIFAALLLALSIFAKSFKEGQSYAGPLQMFIVLPAFASFIPGIKLDWVTSSIPVVNVSLALKEIFTGNLDQHWAHMGMIFLSTCVFAGLFLWFAAWWFQREQVLFRS